MANWYPLSAVVVLLFLSGVVLSAKDASDDEVLSLPGINASFRQFSGYLDGGNGRNLHYWLMESQQDPSTDPLVLWLNGGPGCSSVYGNLGEIGPFIYDESQQQFAENPYGWNKIANVLFLESPAGVGYSYADDGSVASSDIETADQNYLALQDFLSRFPEYNGRDFFVTGESYGGIYVPTLSERVFDGNLSINFQGFAVGNGLSSNAINDNSLLFFAYYHGLVDDNVATRIGENCCPSGVFEPSCNAMESNNLQCLVARDQVFEVVYNSGLNVYSLYRDCEQSSQLQLLKAHVKNVLKGTDFPRKMQAKLDERLKAKPGQPKSDPPCTNSAGLTAYLNRDDVKTALHISDQAEPWTLCSDRVSARFQSNYDTMLPIYQKLLGNGKLRALVYNGDTDMACNYLGDQWFTNSINLTVVKDRYTWLQDGQIAGFAKVFKDLSFVTIRGSGHMVPQERPTQAFKMYQSFLNNEDLS